MIPEAIAQTSRDGAHADTAPKLTPLWREVPADLETPVSAYLKLARGRYGFLLESVEGGERLARYSFVGTDPYMVLRVQDGVAERRWLSGPRAGTTDRERCDDPLHIIQAELERRPRPAIPGLPRFSGGAVGYLAYEVAARYEPSVPIPAAHPLATPEAVFLFSDTLLIFDHVRQRALLLTHADLDATSGDEALAQAEAEARLDGMERRLRASMPKTPRGQTPRQRIQDVTPAPLAEPDAYMAATRRIQEYIRAGDCFQVVLSQRFARPARHSHSRLSRSALDQSLALSVLSRSGRVHGRRARRQNCWCGGGWRGCDPSDGGHAPA